MIIISMKLKQMLGWMPLVRRPGGGVHIGRNTVSGGSPDYISISHKKLMKCMAALLLPMRILAVCAVVKQVVLHYV